MSLYYLIPQTLMHDRAGLKQGQFPVELITTFQGSLKKAHEAARKRERELNDGVEYSAELTIARTRDANSKPAWFVTPEPQYTARSYTNFNSWPCNKQDGDPL